METSCWIGYARSGKELEVLADIAALGIAARVARELVAVRSGKQRWAEPKPRVVLANYVFIDCTDEEWYALYGVKHLARRKLLVPEASVPPIRRFLEIHEREYAAQEARVLAGQRLEQFHAGDPLDVLGGPFMEQLATFREIVLDDKRHEPRIKADVEMMGRLVPVEFDVLDVRKAVA